LHAGRTTSGYDAPSGAILFEMAMAMVTRFHAGWSQGIPLDSNVSKCSGVVRYSEIR
jgi:hypothetical protein